MRKDINHSGDGGIYAELIQNRAFQGNTVFPSTLTPWESVNGATLTLQNTSVPLSTALPTSMNVATSNASGDIGFSNPGYWGIDVKPQTYTGSFWVTGAYSGQLVASLYSDVSKDVWATANITSQSVYGKWTQHNFTLSPTTAAPNANNSFSLTFSAATATSGSLNFNLISLFPPTYNNRPNGLRPDLMTALKGLNPSFLRFPGGNNLEGNNPPYLWRWNETIGPLAARPGRPGTWGYQNTDGLGLVEYLYWCQDLGMEPILAVWAGLYLGGTVVTGAALAPYVQDALDELEFIMGDVSTEYGALREALGYGAEPIMQIRYVEVGNEDNLGAGGGSYPARFQMFYDAIKAKYPDMHVIASTVAYALPGDALGDYHEYTRPDYFVGQFNFFDQANATHKTLIGEYAVVQPNIAAGGGVNWNNPRSPYPFWIGSVAEAVFLLGAERNADAILGASYAPLLQDISTSAAYQWIPDMISYTADSAQDVLSTSYHVVSLLSGTRIGTTLPVQANVGFDPVFYVAGTKAAAAPSSSSSRRSLVRHDVHARQSASSGYILKAAVYNSTSDVDMSVSFPGVTAGATATLTVLTAPNAESDNRIGSDVVQKSVSSVTASGNGTFAFTAKDLSVLVLETD